MHKTRNIFLLGNEPVFSIWTDRTAKDSITFMDLNVGKYKAVKMAFVNLNSERDVYLNFNTESTALCLESLGQLWNLVVLELTETENNYEANFKDIDRMEESKIPLKIVSVLRRNMPNNGGKGQNQENALQVEVTKLLGDMTQSELLEMYQFALGLKSRRIMQMEQS